MATSIGKFSKSFFIKLLVGIIILPFVFWGMGDVFRGGNQNVIATIDSKNISTQEFVNYVNRLNLSQEEIKNIKKTNLLERILSEYIGKKVMALEIEKSAIIVNDNSLRDIIKNDELFLKNNKFSRTEYEKFLLKSNITAPIFEKNIVEQESRRQFLSLISGGITIPKTLIEKEFNKENQIKLIKYIDLEKYYASKKFSNEEKKEIYQKNKDIFSEEFKSMQFAEILPKNFSGEDKFDKEFFNKLDKLENNILDGQSFEEAAKLNNLKSIKINNVNVDKKDKNKKEINNISNNLFEKIFSLKEEKAPQLIKVDNKYFLVEITKISNNQKSFDDPEVVTALNSQLSFKNKLQSNTSIAKDISMGAFDKVKMEKFAKDNNLDIKDYKISNLKQNEIFNEGIIKRIFLIKDGDIALITDGSLSKNFLVLASETKFKNLKKDSNKFEEYEAKAKLNLINNIYRTFDENLNNKYKVDLNNRTIERVKNSF